MLDKAFGRGPVREREKEEREELVRKKRKRNRDEEERRDQQIKPGKNYLLVGIQCIVELVGHL